jgi:hypothetical protein
MTFTVPFRRQHNRRTRSSLMIESASMLLRKHAIVINPDTRATRHAKSAWKNAAGEVNFKIEVDPVPDDGCWIRMSPEDVGPKLRNEHGRLCVHLPLENLRAGRYSVVANEEADPRGICECHVVPPGPDHPRGRIDMRVPHSIKITKTEARGRR